MKCPKCGSEYQIGGTDVNGNVVCRACQLKELKDLGFLNDKNIPQTTSSNKIIIETEITTAEKLLWLAEYEDIGTVNDFKDLKAGAENLNLKGDEILLKPFEVKGFVYDSEEYKQLKAENEQLKKRLENSVQLPCKVGDALYFLREAKYKNPYNLNIETCKVEKLILTEKGWRIKLDANSMYETSLKALGTTLFTTKEAAEARLKELSEVIGTIFDKEGV